MFRFPAAAALALASLTCVTAADAHVTLETQQAPSGSYYKAVVRVPHGCAGAPTTRIRVQIPEGASGVKAQPKPGWQLEMTKGKLAKPYSDGHGGMVTEGVTEVSWSGGRLLDDHYEEFLMRLKLPEAPAGTVVYFPVVQECETGVSRWVEIPAAGKTEADYKEPAPKLTLTAKP